MPTLKEGIFLGPQIKKLLNDYEEDYEDEEMFLYFNFKTDTEAEWIT